MGRPKKVLSPWRTILKGLEAEAAAETTPDGKKKYTAKQVPMVALQRAHEREVLGLNDPNWLVRTKAIKGIAFEWAATVDSLITDEMGDAAVELMKLAGKVLREKKPADAFHLGCMWEKFRFATGPEMIAVQKYQSGGAVGAGKGGKKKHANERLAITKLDEQIINEAMELLPKHPGRDTALAYKLEEKFGASELDYSVGVDKIRDTHIPIAKERLAKKAQQPK